MEEEDNMYVPRMSQPDPTIDTSRVEEIPAKEPKFHAVPLKSVLKKRGSGSGPGTPQNTPTQENRPLTLRQELHASFKLVRDQTTDSFATSNDQLSFIHRIFFFFERLDGKRGGGRGRKKKGNLNFNRGKKAVRKKGLLKRFHDVHESFSRSSGEIRRESSSWRLQGVDNKMSSFQL